MKSLLITSLFLFGLSLASIAQKGKNQLVFSLGTANNLNGTVVQIGSETSSATPVFNVGVDKGMNEKFSIGIAYCYQSISLDRNYYIYTPTPVNNGNYTYYNYTVTSGKYFQNHISQHIGVKFLFHSSSSTKGDLYGGLRLGYQIASSKENLPVSVQNLIGNNGNSNIGLAYATTNGDANITVRNKNRYTQQIILGYRYFWDESFGVFAEGALGFPYFANFGLCLKIN